MKCKSDHEKDGTIPQFLCRACSPVKGWAHKHRLAAVWVDPIEARQRELREAQATAAKAKREAALAKHLRKMEDAHAGEEWDRKSKMWIKTDRAMAKHEARLLAELEASAAQAEEAA